MANSCKKILMRNHFEHCYIVIYLKCCNDSQFFSIPNFNRLILRGSHKSIFCESGNVINWTFMIIKVHYKLECFEIFSRIKRLIIRKRVSIRSFVFLNNRISLLVVWALRKVLRISYSLFRLCCSTLISSHWSG